VHDLDRTWDGLGPRDGPPEHRLDWRVEAVLDGSPDSVRDAQPDAAAVSVDIADAGVDICLPPPDFGPPDSGPVTADGSTDATVGTDGAPGPLLPCIDNDSKSQIQCGPCAPTVDVDCDGLKAGGGFVQDPWPSQHNPLRLGDGFTDDPLAARWSGATSGCEVPSSVEWNGASKSLVLKGCSAATLQPGCATFLKDPDYLVEMRLTIDQFHVTSGGLVWHVEIETSGSKRRCGFIQDGQFGGKPYLRAEGAGGAQSHQGLPQPQPPATYLMQVWGYRQFVPNEHRNHCRLLAADGKQVIGDAMIVSKWSAIGQPGTVVIRASNVDITVDHVRIYEVYDQGP